MGLRDQLRRLRREAAGDFVQVRQQDGTVKKFPHSAFMECFMHECDRWRRHYDGENPGPAHPIVEALRGAAEGEVERLVPTQGTMILHWLGEDAIIRGEMERPGPPVRETSPGRYE